MFKIESYNPLFDDWTDSAEELGHGCLQYDNQWSTEAEALAACDELVRDCGISRFSLRVVPIN